MSEYLKTKHAYKIEQYSFERLAKTKIAEQLPISPDDVYMVWFSFTLGNAKGLFSFKTKTAYPMSHSGSKSPDYIEVTYNRDTQEMYFDWYTKQRQEILDLREVKKMKPKKYPYSGRQRLTKTGLPRFIQLGNIAIDSKLINNIETFEWVGPNETVIHLKILKFFAYEEKQNTVQLKLWQVLQILNRY